MDDFDGVLDWDEKEQELNQKKQNLILQQDKYKKLDIEIQNIKSKKEQKQENAEARLNACKSERKGTQEKLAKEEIMRILDEDWS